MALFPRRIGGKYVMLSRRDRENLHLATSTDVRHWADVTELHRPSESWELLQIGNCGSPLETDEGWLVSPTASDRCGATCSARCCSTSTIRGASSASCANRCSAPRAAEREGYVPNVVYSCGSMLNGRDLVLPYGMSDGAVGIAVVSVPDLLTALRAGH